jgi:hypothetical protein
MSIYRRGDLLIKDTKQRIEKLVGQDEKAREIYTGLEEQVQRLKRIADVLKARKQNGSSQNPDHEEGQSAEGVHS